MRARNKERNIKTVYLMLLRWLKLNYCVSDGIALISLHLHESVSIKIFFPHNLAENVGRVNIQIDRMYT
jgi:hypothetical protein